MAVLQWLVAAMAAISILMAARLIWAWQRLRSHPHVETIDIANPEIALELKQLVADVAGIAEVSIPQLYIRRSQLPNAFVVAAIIRPELFLTDELLEYCDNQENGLQQLTFSICHEIAHIQRDDPLRLGLLTYASQWTSILGLQSLEEMAHEKIADIERQTDMEAEQLVHHLDCNVTTREHQGIGN